MKITGDTITFASGRTLYAHCGVIGIDDKLEISGGWDQGIEWPLEDWQRREGSPTNGDMAELADHMLELWTQFKNRLDK